MCGIAGGHRAEQLINQLSHRGVETHTSGDKFPLGHRLLPIVNHIQQPLERDGRLVANCEIYNWQGLAAEHGIDAANDADFLLALLDRDGIDALEQVDGVYAFAYATDDEILLARDVLGVKPLWYSPDPFAFASERQALEDSGLEARELHPRQMLRYDRDTGNITHEARGFFTVDEHDTDLDAAADQVADRFRDAVRKRVPDEPVALLFSGGVDSTLIASVLQDIGAEFTCYTAGTRFGNVDAPRDRDWADQVADEMGLDHVSVDVDLSEIRAMLPEAADWISSSSVVKLGVAVPFAAALAEADERVVFSGLGAEQLYAGYSRQQGYLNRECLSGLRSLFHRDLYRDDVVAMRHGAELRLPFLDHDLVRHALTIPAEHKVRDGTRKYILREAAERLGVPADVAWRDKTAAQYGSNVDKAIARLAKDAGYDSKQAYCNTFRDRPNHRLAALVSGGKDSHAALYRMQRRNNKISCLVNVQSRNPDSYMYDTKDRSLVAEQAAAIDIPLIVEETAGEKENELAELETALARARDEYGVDGVVAGALASTYQRDRVDRVADKTGLKAFTPLWATGQEAYMRWLVRDGFEIKMTEVAARGLSDDWVGRVLDADAVDELLSLATEHRFSPAGEGGEFETVVLNAPHFQRTIKNPDT